MGCKSSSRERFDKRIIEESCGLLNQTQLDHFYMTYNFTQNEILTLVDEFKKLCFNPNGLITPDNLMDFPPFHYSPFGYHILDVLDLNSNKFQDALEKLENQEKTKKENKLKMKENKKNNKKTKGKSKKKDNKKKSKKKDKKK